MIEFHYEIDFELIHEPKYKLWLEKIVRLEGGADLRLDYIFCTDTFLLEKNRQFLNHDTFTDIITFDYSEKALTAGDIFISIDRVKENSDKYNVRFEEEILRVMAHGVLHLLGYNDKTESEQNLMRHKEDEMIKLFHVEH